MKKIYFSLFLICITASAFSQFSVGAAANYTAYKGDFQKSTPGAHVRLSYEFNEKLTANLGFTYGMPIKLASTVIIADDFNNTTEVASEINFKFKTFSLLSNYRFIGDEETTANFYGQFGAGLVLISYKEDITGSYDKNTYKFPQDQVEKTNENGFTLNLGLGGEYRIGTPVIFAEGGIAFPANQVNNYYVENVIPIHFTVNLGIKIPLGYNGDN